jgi:hypothetical protein
LLLLLQQLLLLQLLLLLLLLLQMLMVLLLHEHMLLQISKHLVTQALQLEFHLLQRHRRRLAGQPRHLCAQLIDDSVLGAQLLPHRRVGGFQLLQLCLRGSVLPLAVVKLQLQRPHMAEGGGVGFLSKCYSFCQQEQVGGRPALARTNKERAIPKSQAEERESWDRGLQNCQ